MKVTYQIFFYKLCISYLLIFLFKILNNEPNYIIIKDMSGFIVYNNNNIVSDFTHIINEIRGKNMVKHLLFIFVHECFNINNSKLKKYILNQ